MKLTAIQNNRVKMEEVVKAAVTEKEDYIFFTKPSHNPDGTLSVCVDRIMVSVKVLNRYKSV